MTKDFCIAAIDVFLPPQYIRRSTALYTSKNRLLKQTFGKKKDAWCVSDLNVLYDLDGY